MHICVAPVESIEARPQLGSDDCHSLGHIALHRPALVRAICSERVKETIVVNCLVSCNQLLVFFAFNLSHMLPVRQIKSIIHGKTSEGFVSDNLVLGCVLEAALGHSEASSIDLVNHHGQSIEFSQVLWRKHNASGGVNHFGRFRGLN